MQATVRNGRDMKRTGANREAVLGLLEELGGVTKANVEEVHRRTNVSEAEIWGAGTFYSLLNKPGKRVRVCTGLTCRMFGADEILAKMQASGTAAEGVSCIGQCDRAPAALDEDLKVISYTERERAVTPDSTELPINLGGQPNYEFAAFKRAAEMSSDQILQALEDSGLQGRGGAGFPAHIKWRAVCGQAETERYVVCNADEAEPGTFKDREFMLRRPDLVVEGLAIAAHVIGAREIYFYIRGEFNAEASSVQAAIEKFKAINSDFDWHIHRGHGAYICGEETALLESLEGKRGMPRLKPPFPVEVGFRNMPTLIHNVESIGIVPAVILHGGEEFKALGKTGAGTKLYCISGHIETPGVYELPLGVTLDELVKAAGGYVGTPHAFSPGGASSGFLPISKKDVPLDFKALQTEGSMLGSAGVVVINDTVDMAQAAQWQSQFFEDESCGQCAPCRIGARWTHNQVTKYLNTGDPSALEYAEDVAWEMEEGSICGLGMVAAKPLESAMKHFSEAFQKRDQS